MPISNAMTVDVEDYFHVSAFVRTISPSDWHRYASRVEHNTHRLMDLFDVAGIKATFFVLGWEADRQPGLIREIAARGHEIACHGWSHRLVYDQTPAEFRDETQRSKALLEDLIGAPVDGYRAASYSITRASTWALDILVELGFTYDSSIFPVRHDRYGMPDACREPHRLLTPAGMSIVEWPLSTLRMMKFNLPVAGGGYFRLFPYWFSRAALARINRHEQRPFIFYLHPWEIDPEQPRVAAGRLSRFRHYNNLDVCEQRLRSLANDFSFNTAREGLRRMELLGA